jgi:hypothetical protein
MWVWGNNVSLHKSAALLMFTIIAFLNSIDVAAYKVQTDTNTEVHQYITQESRDIWTDMPIELYAHFINTYTDDINGTFDLADDLISASGEEDLGPEYMPYMRHFWEPDDADIYYDNGLGQSGSSWVKASDYFSHYVKPNYQKGNKDEAYYYLGRIAHLLQDATVPAHVHLDPHWSVFGDDSLEEYTGVYFTYFDGTELNGQQYNYEALPNMQTFFWSYVEPEDTENSELFRLFWYTAQKTQYYASDDVDGNSIYHSLDDYQYSFSPPLWYGEATNIVSSHLALADDDEHDQGTDVQHIASNVVPHAMKATAGLYRLFWHQVADNEWPEYCHDAQNTCQTSLKGKDSWTDRNVKNFYIDDGVDQYAYVSIADLDENGKKDVVVCEQYIGWRYIL